MLRRASQAFRQRRWRGFDFRAGVDLPPHHHPALHNPPTCLQRRRQHPQHALAALGACRDHTQISRQIGRHHFAAAEEAASGHEANKDMAVRSHPAARRSLAHHTQHVLSAFELIGSPALASLKFLSPGLSLRSREALPVAIRSTNPFSANNKPAYASEDLLRGSDSSTSASSAPPSAPPWCKIWKLRIT